MLQARRSLRLVEIGHVWHLVRSDTVHHEDAGLPRGPDVEREECSMVTGGSTTFLHQLISLKNNLEGLQNRPKIIKSTQNFVANS